MITAFGLLLGLVLLLAGGAALVHGASQIAARLGVSPMVVGLTILAFGTSLPEMVVNVISASSGATSLAFGNVIGSNVANLALVLGIAALIKPIEIQGQLVQRELPLLLLATSILAVMALDQALGGTANVVGRSDALILFLVFGIFLYITILDFVRSRRPDPILADIESSPLVPAEPMQVLPWILVPAGIGMLYFGGEQTVKHSVDLAGQLGVSQTIVGLFVVALGTSMPELVTSAIAAVRGESDLALGNVIGSNLFNTLAVLPASAFVAPVAVPAGGTVDILLSLAFAFVLIPVFVFGKARLGRGVGGAFLAVFVTWVVVRTMS